MQNVKRNQYYMSVGIWDWKHENVKQKLSIEQLFHSNKMKILIEAKQYEECVLLNGALKYTKQKQAKFKENWQIWKYHGQS